ncbi:hypothetical protein J6590_017982 [Homalodisca vitripennis]|nr:hypothetical protein J6590_017982 [Homalodisca vitripennis]
MEITGDRRPERCERVSGRAECCTHSPAGRPTFPGPGEQTLDTLLALTLSTNTTLAKNTPAVALHHFTFVFGEHWRGGPPPLEFLRASSVASRVTEELKKVGNIKVIYTSGWSGLMRTSRKCAAQGRVADVINPNYQSINHARATLSRFD